MNFYANETAFLSVTEVDERSRRYQVCYAAPPHIVSDGLWRSKPNTRSPMKSFLPLFELQVLLIFVVTQICRLLLLPLKLPLFISQMMAGLILQALFAVEPLGTYMRMLFPYGTHDTITTISSIGFVLFIFINGVQMDFSLITRMGKRAWSIAIVGLVVPILIGFVVVLFQFRLGHVVRNFDHFVVALVSHTVISFAVVASLLNDLQIQNSELGKLALSSALVSDVLCTIVTTTGTAFMSTGESNSNEGFKNVLCLFAMGIFVPLVCRPLMFWIIKHTPEGRPVKDGYVYVIIVLLFMLGWLSVSINQEFVLGAFILGLAVPEGPPLGSALVKKLNFFGTTFLLPIFITTCMLKADFSMTYSSTSVLTISLIVILTHLVKIISCLIPALYSNLPFGDALSLSLILNAKGVVEIGLYCFLYDLKIIDGISYGIMILSIIVVAGIVQWSVRFLYDPSRKYAGYQKRNMTSLRPWSELRMLVCIHKPSHISSMIDVVDLFCPTVESPIVVDVLHLIELVGRALPIFIPHRLKRQASGIQHKSYSDDVVLAFDIYEHDNPQAVSAYPCTAIAPPNLMYEDVCNLAFDRVASIIILPFHRRWSIDGEVEYDDRSRRALNCRVLERAPCSVGILVTRPSHKIREASSTRVGVIYLGGQDDEEALCIAKRAIMKEEMSLVVYHVVYKAEKGWDGTEELEEIKHRHARNITYQQIIATEGSQMAAFLSEIAKENDFFIVGRRYGIDSPQTEGLTEWSEFPELGAIADFLASPDLDTRASVLVVQQQFAPKSRKGCRIAQIQKLCNVEHEFNPLELDTPNHCALHLQNTLQQIVSDFPSFEIQDAYIHHLQEEFDNVHLQTVQVANQIDLLARIYNDDSIILEAKLEELEFSLHCIPPKDQKNTSDANEDIDSSKLADVCANIAAENLDNNLEQFELDNKIDEMKLIVKSLQNLQFTVKWFEVVEQIEDALTGLKVLAFDENCIRLSLQTYMPTFEGISYQLRVEEDTIDASELNHELLIEVFEGTMKLKNVFPNDVYLSDIVVYAKSISKSSLQWFIQKVQDRIILSTLRNLVIKDANKSRYSLEYLDKDETIVAHMAGGTDAYIKLSHGWPIFGSPLKLICIKGSDDLKRTSLSFHCKVEKLANSLDTRIRQNISSFVDAVEKVIIEQLQLDLRVQNRKRSWEVVKNQMV
ncbi:unnamed protein product [Sphenostylis stenocarpa]|uniref:Cation/H+ exchanger domain-containing protein n=1 Tax=Sphenostylis stenocarpa TaxID=92480 RepID=A0AA86V9U5_9FABA|nr:unnamed protein product [Sphenostylis stenocarpa]